jgi:protein SCO1/2
VKQLADAVGFHYAWDERTQQYAHPAVLMVLDRAGRITRYLHALGTEPSDFEAALRAAQANVPAEAGQASLAGDLLRCFRFDPALRRHQEAIGRYFRIGGVVLFSGLLSLVLVLLRWERTRRR